MARGTISKQPSLALRAGGRRRSRRVLINLTLVLGSILLALVIGELAIRLLPGTWVPELQNYRAVEFHLGDLVRPSENPRLYYDLRPANEGAGVNAAGYRGPQYPLEKPAGVRRIVGIGDSNMFAWQLREREGYLRQLEALWNSRSPNEGLEVINLAVPGYNTAQHVEVLRTKALALAPDLIILGYDHNDPEPIASAGQRTYLVPDHYGDNLLGSRLVRWVWRKTRMLRWSRSLRDPRGNTLVAPTLPGTAAYLCEGPRWEEHLVDLKELGKAARERGGETATRQDDATARRHGRSSARGAETSGRAIPVVVVIHDAWITADPGRRSDHYRRLHAPLLAFFHERGWHVLDCYDLLQDYMAEKGERDLRTLWMNAQLRDGHPNARAHRLIADALVELIRDKQLLVPAVDAGGAKH